MALVEVTDDLNMHADTLVEMAVVLGATGRAKEASDVLDEANALYMRKGNVVAAGSARRRREDLHAR
jgi:hypothetical protein